MNGEADFIVYRKDNCFVLPNKAIYTDEEGKSYILFLGGSNVDDKGVERATIQKAEITVYTKGRVRAKWKETRSVKEHGS